MQRAGLRGQIFGHDKNGVFLHKFITIFIALNVSIQNPSFFWHQAVGEPCGVFFEKSASIGEICGWKTCFVRII